MKITEQKVLVGVAPYDAGATYKIEIIKTNFRPGSGENEDPPEIMNDEYGIFYKVKYTSPDELEAKAEGAYYSSLEEAKSNLETVINGIVWRHEV